MFGSDSKAHYVVFFKISAALISISLICADEWAREGKRRAECTFGRINRTSYSKIKLGLCYLWVLKYIRIALVSRECFT